MTNSTDSERARFETWASERDYILVRTNYKTLDYANGETDRLWRCWQVASSENASLREELAKCRESNWANRRRADAAEGELSRTEAKLAEAERRIQEGQPEWTWRVLQLAKEAEIARASDDQQHADFIESEIINFVRNAALAPEPTKGGKV